MKNAKLHWKLKRSVSAPKCQYSPAGQSLIPSALPGAIRAQFRPKKLNQKAIPAHARAHFSPGTKSALQSRTKLLEKVFPIMSTFLRNKTISRTTYCGEKSPSPNSMLLPTNAQGSGFLLNTQQHCFQGKGEREKPVQLRCLEKCCPSIQFSQQFCPRL